jgi:hypothetical protein
MATNVAFSQNDAKFFSAVSAGGRENKGLQLELEVYPDKLGQSLAKENVTLTQDKSPVVYAPPRKTGDEWVEIPLKPVANCEATTAEKYAASVDRSDSRIDWDALSSSRGSSVAFALKDDRTTVWLQTPTTNYRVKLEQPEKEVSFDRNDAKNFSDVYMNYESGGDLNIDLRVSPANLKASLERNGAKYNEKQEAFAYVPPACGEEWVKIRLTMVPNPDDADGKTQMKFVAVVAKNDSRVDWQRLESNRGNGESGVAISLSSHDAQMNQTTAWLQKDGQNYRVK